MTQPMLLLLLLELTLPCLLWTQGPESAPALKDAGIDRICVPAGGNAADGWRTTGVSVRLLTAEEIAAREALATPGITARAGLASPTRVPWVTANGWQLRRKPAGKYAYDVPAGRGALAAAEAFAYGADATLKIDPADLPDVGRMLAFLSKLPAADLPDIGDIAVVDDGSPLVGEVMNLLERRNLLFEIVRKPSPRFRINIALGTKEYPQAEAADPSAFALKIRRQLTDEQRTLRIYGSEVVIARLTGDAQRVRLHLLNYAGREIQGLRIHLRGTYREDKTFIASSPGTSGTAPGPATLGDFVAAGDATEFSVPAMGLYAVIDLMRLSVPTSKPRAN